MTYGCYLLNENVTKRADLFVIGKRLSFNVYCNVNVACYRPLSQKRHCNRE